MTETMLEKLYVLCFLITALVYLGTADLSSCRNHTARARDCCKIPGIIKQPIVDACDDKFPHTPPQSEPQRGGKKLEGSCVVQCMFESIGAFKNNSLDMEDTRRHILETAGMDRDFGPLLNDTIDLCYKNVTETPAFSVKPISFEDGRPGCSFIPQEMNDCVKTLLFYYCPPANWNQSNDCDDLKEKVDMGCSYSSLY
ncbi:general odorant-binding protein 67-like [Ochlerotatus camptorhynchus]|uniref:general odorant-binding protein 67-like n=1 Tax=Ochlerotatus camptorhynchus TaxID=644619 RepID=UPI0031DAC48C